MVEDKTNHEGEACVMNELEKISSKLDEHDKEIGEIKVSLGLNTELTKRAVVSNEELTKTMVDMQLTMRDVSNSLKRSDENDKEIKEGLDKLKTEFKEIKESQTINWIKFVKDNFWKILGSLILLSMLNPEFGKFLLQIFK